MPPVVETSTPPGTPTPIGPYHHVAKVGPFIAIGGTAGVDPATGLLAGADVAAQTRQILRSFGVMLESVGSDLGHVVHVNVFLAWSSVSWLRQAGASGTTASTQRAFALASL